MNGSNKSEIKTLSLADSPTRSQNQVNIPGVEREISEPGLRDSYSIDSLCSIRQHATVFSDLEDLIGRLSGFGEISIWGLDRGDLDKLHKKEDIVFFDNYVATVKPSNNYLMFLDSFGIPGDMACGEIQGFREISCTQGGCVLYPEVEAGKLNPWNSFKSVRNSASRLVGKLKEFGRSRLRGLTLDSFSDPGSEAELDIPFLITMELTFPEGFSQLFLFKPRSRGVRVRCRICDRMVFADSGKIEKIKAVRDYGRSGKVEYLESVTVCGYCRLVGFVWSVLKVFLDRLSSKMGGDLATWGNFHPWKTSEPTKPHAHLHLNLLNFILDNDKLVWFDPWIYERDLKELWKEVLEDCGIRVVDRGGSEVLPDLRIRHIKICDRNSPWLIHRIKYCSRKPVIDLWGYFAEGVGNCFSPEGDLLRVDNPDFCEWLLEYKNVRRAFGFATNLKNYQDYPVEAKSSCPVCAEPYTLVGYRSMVEVLHRVVCEGLPVVFWSWRFKRYFEVRVRSRGRPPPLEEILKLVREIEDVEGS